MATPATRLSPPYEHSRCALPQIALITARRFPSRSPKSFPWHEPLEVCQSEAATGRLAATRMGDRLAEGFSPPAQAVGLGQLYVRLP